MKKDKYTFISYIKEELELVDWMFVLECIVETLPLLLTIPINVFVLYYCANNMPFNMPTFIQILIPLALMACVLFIGVYIHFMICDYHDQKERHKKELRKKRNESRSIDE